MKLKISKNTKLADKLNQKESVYNYDLDNFPVNKIVIESNVRSEYTGLDELANSIKVDGQLQRIGISTTPNKDGLYILIYGHRRFKAITEVLKNKTIKVELVQNENTTINQLIENIQREDLTDYDLASAIRKLKNETKKTDLELAKALNKSRKWINDKLSHYEISEMHVDVQNIETSKVMEIRSLKPKKQKEILEKVKKENLSLKETREEVRKAKEETPKTLNSEIKERGESIVRTIDEQIKRQFRERRKNLYGKFKTYTLKELFDEVVKAKSEYERLESLEKEKSELLKSHRESKLFDTVQGREHLKTIEKENLEFEKVLAAAKVKYNNLLEMELIEYLYQWK